MIWTGLGRYRDVGLLIVRLGLGIAFMLHGWPKIKGGPQMWAGLGNAAVVGTFFLPAAWGFMAAVAEFFGGLFLALGLLFRPTCIILTIQMAFAVLTHLHQGQGFNAFSHALEDGIVFLGLILIGPGKYSIDRK